MREGKHRIMITDDMCVEPESADMVYVWNTNGSNDYGYGLYLTREMLSRLNKAMDIFYGLSAWDKEPESEPEVVAKAKPGLRFDIPPDDPSDEYSDAIYQAVRKLRRQVPVAAYTFLDGGGLMVEGVSYCIRDGEVRRLNGAGDWIAVAISPFRIGAWYDAMKGVYQAERARLEEYVEPDADGRGRAY